MDGKWYDREGISLLIYAVTASNHTLTKLILEEIKGRDDILNGKISKAGYPTIGIPGSMTPLLMAISVSKFQIVTLLLEQGAKPDDMDKTGNTVLHTACALGRLENVKEWLKRFPNDSNKLNQGNTILGATPLCIALYMSQHNYDLVKYLIEECHANVDLTSDSGFTMLMAACANEDADVRTVRYILERVKGGVNRRMKSRTWKWFMLRSLSKAVVKLGGGGMMKRIVDSCGLTALHYAARRGDVDAVKVLMEYGADPNVKTDRGVDVLNYCDQRGPFPKVRAVLEGSEEDEEDVK